MGYTAAERDELRGGIERTHAEAREAIEKQYIEDKNALEETYHEDIEANAVARRDALVAAGLNPNGSDPRTASPGGTPS